MDNNNNLQRSKAIDNMTKTITYRLRSGELQTFDVSKEACEPFGFYFGERAKVRAGKTAWVLGVQFSTMCLADHNQLGETKRPYCQFVFPY